MDTEKRESIGRLLRCPCATKSTLVDADSGLRCIEAACPHSTKPFVSVAGIPVLVSTLRTDTLCTASYAAPSISYVKRKPTDNAPHNSGFFSYGDGVTSDNCGRFVDLVKKQAPNPRVLVIGSGTRGRGTADLWEASGVEIVGIDIYPSSSVDYIADAHYLPFEDSSFDGVFIQAVLEHVLSPVDVVSEIFRVLREGGVVYSETPFMQQVHEGAYDFTRFTLLGHRALFKQFVEVQMGAKNGPGEVLAWSIRYLIWGLTRSRLLGVAASLPFKVLGAVLDRFVDKRMFWDCSSGVYFLGVKNTATQLRAAQIPDLYRGMQRV